METSRDARRGLGPAWVAIALGVLVACAFFVSSRVEDNVSPLPLELRSVGARAEGQGAVLVGVVVQNVSKRGIEVLDVAVPDVTAARSGTGTNDRTIPIAPSATAQFLIRLPARCPDKPKLDHLRVQVRVDGRAIQQTLRLGRRLELDCS